MFKTGLPLPRWFPAALAGLFLVLASAGTQLYRSEREHLIAQAGKQLLAVAELKSRQISSWRQERLADAQVLADDKDFTRLVARWLASGLATGKDPLLSRLTTLSSNYAYSDILILDHDGKLRFRLTGRGLDSPDALAPRDASRRARLTDFIEDSKSGERQAYVIAPLLFDGQSIGSIALQINPAQSLFPSLQSWPLPSETAEIHLVRRAEGELLYLNHPRQPASPADTLRRSATRLDTLAVDAIFNDRKGIIEGNNQAGKPVIGVAQAVPETPWFIVAEIAREEALGGWLSPSGLVIGLITGLLAACLSIFGLLLQGQRIARYDRHFANEAAARADDERFRIAFNASPLASAIARIDNGLLVDANPNFLRDFGWQRNEMLGKTVQNLGLWTDTRAHRRWLVKLIREGWLVNYEAEWRDRKGILHNVELSAATIDIDGTPHVLAFVSDVTTRRRSESELAEYRRRLESMVHERTRELALAKERAEGASRAKSAFLANMSHEFRTPLNTVIGLTHILQRDAGNERDKARLGRVADAAEHLLEVINDILDIAKIEAERFELEESDFSLREIIQRGLEIYNFPAHEKGLVLIADIADNFPPAVHGDPRRLQQILLNYLSNAIKFTEHGHIRLSAHLVERSADSILLRIEVEDSGIGIDNAMQGRLFQPFEQADDSTTRRFGGTGLGLAISRKLAQMMGGATGMQGNPSQGSTFWFTARLKIAQSPSDSVHQAASLPNPALLPEVWPEDVAATLERLAAIPGLDTHAGLTTMNGKVDRYIKLLEMYVGRHEKVSEEIGQSLANDDLATAHRLAHTQKGATASLGLEAIRTVAAKLDQAIRENHPRQEMIALNQEFDRVQQSLCRAILEALGPRVKEPAAAANQEQAQQLIEKLQPLLREDNMACVGLAQNNSALLSVALGLNYPAFQRHLENFDFPQALELLDKALARLKE